MLAIVLIADGLAYSLKGMVYGIAGSMLALWELGWLVVASAGAGLTTGVIYDVGFNGATFTPYYLDATPFIMGFVILFIVSAMLTIKSGAEK